MKLNKFITTLLIILLITGTFVNVHTLRTDIHILQIQNGTLTDEVVSLKLAQERTDSRLRYTATVAEIEPIIKAVEDNKVAMDGMIFKYKNWDELVKQFFGEK